MAVKFGSNFTNEDLKQAKEIVELVNKTSNPGIQNKILNRNRPEVETIARGMVAGYDPDFGEEMGSLDYTPQGTLTPRAANNSSLNILNNLNKARDFRQQELNRMQGSLPVMPYTYPGGEGNQELGIAGAYQAMDPDMFDPDTGEYINFLDRIDQQRALNAGQGIASVAPVNPMAQERAADYMRALQMGQTEDYKDFFFDEASRDPSIFDPLQSLVQKAFGYPEGMRGLYEMEQNKKAAMARNEELEEFSRKDREDRERAALLAAQQQQPVDPCPEGYRLDPVSKVCVPVDDTTEPTDPVTRTYDTMTRPEPNYTAATNFNVPAINLPDIFTGN